MRRLALAILSLACICVVGPTPSVASDHADPIFNTDPDGGLTGLFVFPSGGEKPDTDGEASVDAASGAESDGMPEPEGNDELIFILGIHPSLSTPGPYDLDRYEYNIFIDHHSDVTFQDPADLARYGGTIVHPAGISADVSLSFRLDNDAKLTQTEVDGMDANRLEMVSGVYDDPFIFPRFFGKNIVAIAIRVPYSELPAGRQDFLIWGTSTEVESSDQVDHVGRSNRTQLPRFDFLNTVPPGDHVEVIGKTDKSRQRRRNFLKRFPPPASYQAFDLLRSIRHYDFVADVMVFSLRNPPGYPNGRRLEDDIVALSCSVGDCLLQETSFQESEAWPRITTNDKPLASEFPFLAPPWPDKKPESQPGCLLPVLLFLIVLAFITWIFFKIVCKLCRRFGGGGGAS